MKRLIPFMIFLSLLSGEGAIPFSIDVRPRVIDDSKILVNVEVTNNVNRPVDYLEGFLSEYSGKGDLLTEHRMVLVYSYEPPLQNGFSTIKTMQFTVSLGKPHTYKFNISKIKFLGESRVFAWHSKSGFIRID